MAADTPTPGSLGGPPVPVVTYLFNSRTVFEPQADGGMTLHFVPMAGPGAMLPFGYAVVLHAEGWQRFQAAVARAASPLVVASPADVPGL